MLIKKNQIFLIPFLKRKNRHALIRKFNPTLNEKNYYHLTFVQYKKNHINLFYLYSIKNIQKKRRKKLKKKKN